MGPIGIFDSGVGGLTILNAIHTELPDYDTLYVGDSARAPYGPRSHAELVEYTWQAAEWLFQQGCDLVILACNAASSSALREIQQTRLSAYPGKRILGIIRPTVEFLAEAGYAHIAILSTVATKNSGAYVREFAHMNPSINIYSQSCPNWGPLVETGQAKSEAAIADIQKELQTLEATSLSHEAILLACTHYPYLTDTIKATLKRPVPIYNQGTIVAKSLTQYLARHPEISQLLKTDGGRRYFVTGDPKLATTIARQHFGFDVEFSKLSL